jgi:hypothetical protein
MSQPWHPFNVNRTLLPQQKGTKKFLRRYGDRLVCVRYRYDTEQQRTITTVEVVVDKRPWAPDPQRMNLNTRLSLKFEYGEVGVGKTIRATGGIWDTQQKVWKLAYKQVVALGWLDRIVSEGNDKEVG